MTDIKDRLDKRKVDRQTDRLDTQNDKTDRRTDSHEIVDFIGLDEQLKYLKRAR